MDLLAWKRVAAEFARPAPAVLPGQQVLFVIEEDDNEEEDE
jgi:hypothetical protein